MLLLNFKDDMLNLRASPEAIHAMGHIFFWKKKVPNSLLLKATYPLAAFVSFFITAKGEARKPWTTDI